jgi:transposase
VLRKKLRRDQVLEFFARLPSCVVAMEACGGAHFWGREINELGHEVKLIPPAYVKPFVKRQKNDEADAEAICEAATRPTMRFVPVKSEEKSELGLVFPAPQGGILQHTRTQDRFRKLLEKVGVTMRWHDLRHFAVSLWIEQDFSIKEIMTFAGHSSIQMTMERYGHLFPSPDHQKAMAMVEAKLLG